MKTTAQTQAAGTATLTAKLIDAEMKSKGQAATVEVAVKGITLIDPARVNEKPKTGKVICATELIMGR